MTHKYTPEQIAQASAYASIIINKESDQRFETLCKETGKLEQLGKDDLDLVKKVYRIAFAAGTDWRIELEQKLRAKLESLKDATRGPCSD